MPANVISGRVVLKETGVGIPDLLVVIYDADPGTTAEKSIVAPEPRSPGNTRSVAPGQSGGDRLGSRLTDKSGAFEFAYENEEFQIRNAGEKRPDLLLMVVAPEGPDTDLESSILFTAPRVRQSAGRTEQYLIRIPTALLVGAGIPVPLDPSVAKEEARAVIGKITQAVDYRVQLGQEAKTIAVTQVAAARQAAQQSDDVIEARLIEKITGITPEQAERLNVVLPGTKTDTVVWQSVNRRIDTVLNQQGPVAGYLVVSESDALRFRDANGEYRSDISAGEIEPLLYHAHSDAQRPTFLVRHDPADHLRRASAAPDPFVEPNSGPVLQRGTPMSRDGGPSTSRDIPDDKPVKPEDLPKFVGRLIGGIMPPEQPGISAPQTRPTPEDVQNNLQSLQLRPGPAEVTAFHDFHNLQIAFDYVWQQVIDDGILETGKTLTRQIIEQGGDPLAALESGSDPVTALRKEAQYVRTAQQSLQAAGIAFRLGAVLQENGSASPTTTPMGPIPGGHILDRFDDITTLPTQAVDPSLPPMKPRTLLDELEEMLSERYKFEVFAPGSSNFGLLVTYRQKWDLVTYQVGDLVHTLTLAPKEMRKVTTKRTVKKERSVKEMENNLRSRKDETSDTMRDDAEIVQKALDKTNFNLNAKGTYNIGIAKGDSTTTVDKNAEAASQETKKSFHEAVLKAAQEFKSERKLEVETKEIIDEEVTDSAEITNPNDELTVAYLFYELQRRYRVSEHIHRLTPVVLVAMEVPNPNRRAIDRVLLAHSWIINRVLLDDRYRAPLDYLCTRIVGDELALQELANNVAAVRLAVDELKKMHRDLQAALAAREAALTSAIEARAGKVSGENTEGLGEKALEFVFGSGDEEDLEAARMREDLAKDAYERTVREEKDLRMRLDSETATLSAAAQAYAKAVAEHTNHLLEVAGLRVHFKENALYYMQAIWSFTFQDQIFFSLFNVKVPKLTAAQKTYGVAEPAEMPLSVATKPGQIVLEVRADMKLASGLDPAQEFVTLVEVADLDHPLGFKGNYMIFPLRQSNALTDFMMVPYIDSDLGIHDPDHLGSWTPEDFAKYARCLQESLRDELSDEEFAALQAQLKAQYKRIVSNPRPTNDEIIVPSSSLYIEALPGKHPLIEDFKLAHRELDVEKAREEARKLKLENLRYAARILGSSEDFKLEHRELLDDPDVDRKIIIDGAPEHVVVPTDGN